MRRPRILIVNRGGDSTPFSSKETKMKFITSRHDDDTIAVQGDLSICWSPLQNTVSIETTDRYIVFVADKVTLYDLELHYGPVRDYPDDVRCMGCGVIIKNCDDFYAQCDACFDKMVDGGYGSH